MAKSIYFSVTSDLVTDQRMMRICSSLHAYGYEVTLIGRDLKTTLCTRPYKQIRLKIWFKKGKWMYIEYNLRLLLFLLTHKKPDVYVAIDLDTIIPVYISSLCRSVKRVYDAHEWFSEMKEVISRPAIRKVWKWIEVTFVPKFKHGYTVSYSIAESFKHLYGVSYSVIMNATIYKEHAVNKRIDQTYLLYQGAVNKGRCLEWLIPAMKQVDMPLWICGTGNFIDEARLIIEKNNLNKKVKLMGVYPPAELTKITKGAFAGINLVEPVGQNQFMSLANKFFDYFHAGIPQLTMNFPEYKKINEHFIVAIQIDQPTTDQIANNLNKLIHNKVLYQELKKNCANAARLYNWQAEEKKLIEFYSNLF